MQNRGRYATHRNAAVGSHSLGRRLAWLGKIKKIKKKREQPKKTKIKTNK